MAEKIHNKASTEIGHEGSTKEVEVTSESGKEELSAGEKLRRQETKEKQNLIRETIERGKRAAEVAVARLEIQLSEFSNPKKSTREVAENKSPTLEEMEKEYAALGALVEAGTTSVAEILERANALYERASKLFSGLNKEADDAQGKYNEALYDKSDVEYERSTLFAEGTADGFFANVYRTIKSKRINSRLRVHEKHLQESLEELDKANERLTKARAVLDGIRGVSMGSSETLKREALRKELKKVDEAFGDSIHRTLSDDEMLASEVWQRHFAGVVAEARVNIQRSIDHLARMYEEAADDTAVNYIGRKRSDLMHILSELSAIEGRRSYTDKDFRSAIDAIGEIREKVLQFGDLNFPNTHPLEAMMEPLARSTYGRASFGGRVRDTELRDVAPRFLADFLEAEALGPVVSLGYEKGALQFAQNIDGNRHDLYRVQWLMEKTKFEKFSKLKPFPIETDDVRAWRTFVESKRARELVGEDLLSKIDEQVYGNLLDRVLSGEENSHAAIVALALYERPETVRALLLLAATKGGYELGISSVLSELTKRPGWDKLVEETAEKYPNLADARDSLLLKGKKFPWGQDRGSADPLARKLADAEARKIVAENTNENEGPRVCAIMALSPEGLVALARENKSLDKEVIENVATIILDNGTAPVGAKDACENEIRDLLIQPDNWTKAQHREMFSLWAKELADFVKSGSIEIAHALGDSKLYSKLIMYKVPQLAERLMGTVKNSTLLLDKKNRDNFLEGLEIGPFNVDKIAAFVKIEREIQERALGKQEEQELVRLFCVGKVDTHQLLEKLLREDIETLRTLLKFGSHDPLLYGLYAKDNSTLENLRQFDAAFPDLTQKPSQVVLSACKWGQISHERAMQIAKILKRDPKALDVIEKAPGRGTELGPYLGSDIGLELATMLSLDSGLYTCDERPDMDDAFGKHEIESRRKRVWFTPKPTAFFGAHVDSWEDKMMHADLGTARGPLLTGEQSSLVVDEKSWRRCLTAYVEAEESEDEYVRNTRWKKKEVLETFNRPEVKDACLAGMRSGWSRYLSGNSPVSVPFTTMFEAREVGKLQGGGHIAQVGSLSRFIEQYSEAMASPGTAIKTVEDNFEGVKSIESRFEKDGWSNEERSEFYEIGADFLKNAPSLFDDVLSLSNSVSPAELKKIVRKILPLYRARLSLMNLPETKKIKEAKALVAVRKDLRSLAKDMEKTRGLPVVDGEDPIKKHEEKLKEDIISIFRERFAIIKIPENFGESETRAVKNISLWLANMNRDHHFEQADALLGFYLALMINGKWDEFKRGEPVDPKEYLQPKEAEVVEELIEKEKEYEVVTAKNLGAEEKDMPALLEAYEREESVLAVEDVETIDVKMFNISRNIHDMEDPDLYDDPADKMRISLLSKHGNKVLGSAAAKYFQRLRNPKKELEVSAEESLAQRDIESALASMGRDLTPENIKLVFQDGMKSLAVVSSVLSLIRNEGLDEATEELRASLRPSEEIVTIFQKIKEGFEPNSGARALSEDIDYLSNILVKRESMLTPEELALAKEYVRKAGECLNKLYPKYDLIKEKFANLSRSKGADALSKNPKLAAKLKEVGAVVTRQDSREPIVTTATSDLNEVIENIRECLSCRTTQVNNDSNLSFGSKNKFFVLTRGADRAAGSVSDEIVYLEKTVGADGSESVALVMDTIYGRRAPSIFLNHVAVLGKKIREMKKVAPGAEIGLYITNEAKFTGGYVGALGDFEKDVKKLFGPNCTVTETDRKIEPAKTAFNRHYPEYSSKGFLITGL